MKSGFVFVATLFGAGLGCGAILDADFDRPGASSGGDGGADAATEPPAAGGACDACATGPLPTMDGGGHGWTSEPSPLAALDESFESVWVSPAGDAYAVGGGPYDPGGIFHSTGDGRWTKEEVANGVNRLIHRVWGTGGELFAAAEYTFGLGQPDPLLRSVGDGSWIAEAVGPTPINRIWDVWGASAFDFYTVADSGLRHFANGAWASESTPPLGSTGWPYRIWGDVRAVFVVGYDGYIAQAAGNGTWTLQSSGTTEDLVAIWGTSGNDVYVVGAHGTILHSTGDRAWTAQASGTTERLTGIWGSGTQTSGEDIVVVGYGGTILRSTGDGRWLAQPVVPVTDFSGVSGSGRGDIYAVGAGPIYHWR